MSLRHMSRVVLQGGARAVQGIREHAARSIKDTAVAGSNAQAAAAAPTPSGPVRRLSVASSANSNLKSATMSASADQRKRAEESLRTVMFLSCWGPN